MSEMDMEPKKGMCNIGLTFFFLETGNFNVGQTFYKRIGWDYLSKIDTFSTVW